MASLSVDQLRERRRQKILARSQAVTRIARYNESDEGNAFDASTGFGNLRTANWRTGNMRTNSANYGREPRVQCEPESANFLCN